MASPTFAEVWGQIRNAIDIAVSLRTEAANVITMVDAGIAALEGDAASDEPYRAVRARFDAAIRAVRAVVDRHLEDLGKAISSDAPPGSRDFWADLHYYMHTQGTAQTLNSRDLTSGAIAGSTGTGSGTIARCLVDWEGYPLESRHLGVITAECVSDEQTGETQWQEAVELSMIRKSPDLLEDAGCGYVQTLRGLCGDGLLNNASFQSQNLANAAISGWYSDLTINASNFTTVSAGHRTSPEERGTATGSDSPKSITINASGYLRQKLRQAGSQIDWDRPYIWGVAAKPAADTNGTLSFGLGATSDDVVWGGSQTAEYTYHLPGMDKGLWARNFNQSDLYFNISYAHTSGDKPTIDDVILAPMDAFNGGFYAFVPLNTGGDTQTPALKGYKRTFTDSAAADSALMSWLHLLYFESQPTPWNVSVPTATGGGETIED